MALNLHSYQEDNQMIKFEKIAKKIVEYDIDVACFCEVSQGLTSQSNPAIQDDNALIIITRLINEHSSSHYECRWEFSHYGFAVYEEGIGIITKLPITHVESRFVSKSVSPFDFRSRKIMKLTCDDSGNQVNVFVIHTNADDDPYDPFKNQFANLQSWIKEDANGRSILAGDFGIEPTQDSYDLLINENYIDHYVQALPEGTDDYTFLNPEGLEYENERKLRLDYVFSDNSYSAVAANRFFLEDDPVSDHVAVYVELK